MGFAVLVQTKLKLSLYLFRLNRYDILQDILTTIFFSFATNKLDYKKI